MNGVRRQIIIDSGANTTALSTADAEAAGLNSDESPFPVIRATVNGDVSARTRTVRRVTIGTIATTDLGIVTSPPFGDTDVIGINFLAKLGSWLVEKNTFILTPIYTQTLHNVYYRYCGC